MTKLEYWLRQHPITSMLIMWLLGFITAMGLR